MDQATSTVTWNFNSGDYTNRDVPPGTYTFTYQVAAGTGSETFTIDLVVTDPCDPPTSLTKVALENQSYTLTDNDKFYTHPDFSISPDYCPVDYSYDATTIVDGSDNYATTVFISEEKKLQFFWDTNKSPLTQTQTVTVTGTSTTIYNRNKAPETDSSTFTLDFADPCIDANFVTITEVG